MDDAKLFWNLCTGTSQEMHPLVEFTDLYISRELTIGNTSIDVEELKSLFSVCEPLVD